MIEVIFEDERWQAAGLEALAPPAERAALMVTGRPPEGFETALLACDDTRIATLNADFRGKNRPTNVLSWPASTTPPLEGGPLGDIAIAFETCQREAAERGISLANHATHLLIHAMLHLLGHDHLTPPEAEEMEALEIKALAKLGISNPY